MIIINNLTTDQIIAIAGVVVSLTGIFVPVYLHYKSNRRAQDKSESPVDNIDKEMPKQNINPPTQAPVTTPKPQETKSDGGVKDYESGLYFYNKKNYREAKRLFESAVNKGNAEAMYFMGRMYDNIEGVPQDYQKAMEWFKKAAENGNAEAMFSIGTIYGKAKGVSRDYQQAMEWFKKAAENGSDRAMCSIGIMYRYGTGVEKNYQKAKQYFQNAFDMGNDTIKEIVKEHLKELP